MERTVKNQKGFAAIEAVLVLVIVVSIAAVGWYVSKALHSINGTYSSATQTSNNASPKFSTSKKQSIGAKPTIKTTPSTYFTIKEWGVRAPYSGSDTFTYTLSNNSLATVVSKQLAADNSACSSYGAGQIERLTGSQGTYSDGSGPTVAAVAKQDPADYPHIGTYYYHFMHDQAVCASSVTDQNAANDAVKTLVTKFQAVP